MGESTASFLHPAWLPDPVFRPLGAQRVALDVRDWEAKYGAEDRMGSAVLETIRDELTQIMERSGGARVEPNRDEFRKAGSEKSKTGTGNSVILLEIVPTEEGGDDPEAYVISTLPGGLKVTATHPRGLIYGAFELVRQANYVHRGPTATEATKIHRDGFRRYAPVTPYRMLDHWDNIAVDPVNGQVERGYSGGSIFYEDGKVREDLSRVTAYARMLNSVGINRVCLNNVKVGPVEAQLIQDLLPDTARIADEFRKWGITTFVAVAWESPELLGGLQTSDPLDPDVRRWWRETADRVWAAIPDFGGFVVKADSGNQPGPLADERSHAEGANMLAEAVAPHGGQIYWRAYDYRPSNDGQGKDWRDRKTDQAKAVFDEFVPHDGEFADNVIVQIKHGPMDFQPREPVSPAIAALPKTRVAAEFQVTAEYLGQQQHAVYLAPMWSQIMQFEFWGPGGGNLASTVASGGGFVGVSNVGDDEFWTGHPLAQANLYAFGRLTWDPTFDPEIVLSEWIGLTMPGIPSAVRNGVHQVLDNSWTNYEKLTAPLGVGFMVTPNTHYGPSPDGYEYSPGGSAHFADHGGIGVDRTRATGSAFTGQYPAPWRDIYENLTTCPDELLLFFHHVPYDHVLHSGKTVVQHVYDTHFEGHQGALAAADVWATLKPLLEADGHREFAARVSERFAEQVRNATDWRDVINAYFYRHSGIPDESDRAIY